jgi:hypothetical protein
VKVEGSQGAKKARASVRQVAIGYLEDGEAEQSKTGQDASVVAKNTHIALPFIRLRHQADEVGQVSHFDLFTQMLLVRLTFPAWTSKIVILVEHSIVLTHLFTCGVTVIL